MLITDLAERPHRIYTLARWHFDYWGPLTSADTAESYLARLTDAAQNRTVPSVLIAAEADRRAAPVRRIIAAFRLTHRSRHA